MQNRPEPPLGALTTLLEAWRSDADRWQREIAHADGLKAQTATLLCQRVATLIDMLRESRDLNREISTLALSKAAELSARVEAMGSELKALRSVALLRGRAPFSSTPAVIEGAGGGGPDFSSTTAVGGATGGGGGGAFRTTHAEVVAIDDPICSIRSEAVGMPVPCFASHAHPGHVARCTFCDRTMLPLHHPKG